MKVQWSRPAEFDLDDQIHHIAQDNLEAALRMEQRILERVGGLAEYPQAGRIGRVAGTRELPIPRTPYVAIYEVRDRTILVLRLMHGARQWPPTKPSG